MQCIIPLGHPGQLPFIQRGAFGAPEPAHHGKLRFMRSCFAYYDSSSVSS